MSPDSEKTQRIPLAEIPIDKAIRLRQFTEADAEPLFALIDANRDHLSQHGDTTAEKYPDVASVLESIRKPVNPNRQRFGIMSGETLLGTINITPCGSQTAEIGYWVSKDALREGLATDATRAVLKYGRETLGFSEIIAKTHPRNGASMVVLRRNGFAPVEVTPEDVLFRHESEPGPKDLILDVEPIHMGCYPLDAVEAIDDYVELPLRQACRAFYAKGIETFWSSANRNDIGHTSLRWLSEVAVGCYRDEDTDDRFFAEPGQAALLLEFDLLSPQNQQYAVENLPVYRFGDNQYGVENIVLFRYPLRADTPISEVENAFVECAAPFAPQ